jgi:hypothetical protein
VTRPSPPISDSPLVKKDVIVDPKHPSPLLAIMLVDGGRIQIRPGPSQPKPEGHGRESKVAVLETYQSEAHQADPTPMRRAASST